MQSKDSLREFRPPVTNLGRVSLTGCSAKTDAELWTEIIRTIRSFALMNFRL